MIIVIMSIWVFTLTAGELIRFAPIYLPWMKKDIFKYEINNILYWCIFVLLSYLSLLDLSKNAILNFYSYNLT